MVDTLQPRSLSCFRIRKRRHENRMDLRRANPPEPLNMTWAGERSEQPRSFQPPEMFFLLTLPFIERRNRKLTQRQTTRPERGNQAAELLAFVSRTKHLELRTKDRSILHVMYWLGRSSQFSGLGGLWPEA